jgi:hypothetical protein
VGPPTYRRTPNTALRHGVRNSDCRAPRVAGRKEGPCAQAAGGTGSEVRGARTRTAAAARKHGARKHVRARAAAATRRAWPHLRTGENQLRRPGPFVLAATAAVLFLLAQVLVRFLLLGLLVRPAPRRQYIDRHRSQVNIQRQRNEEHGRRLGCALGLRLLPLRLLFLRGRRLVLRPWAAAAAGAAAAAARRPRRRLGRPLRPPFLLRPPVHLQQHGLPHEHAVQPDHNPRRRPSGHTRPMHTQQRRGAHRALGPVPRRVLSVRVAPQRPQLLLDRAERERDRALHVHVRQLRLVPMDVDLADAEGALAEVEDTQLAQAAARVGAAALLLGQGAVGAPAVALQLRARHGDLHGGGEAMPCGSAHSRERRAVVGNARVACGAQRVGHNVGAARQHWACPARLNDDDPVPLGRWSSVLA